VNDWQLNELNSEQLITRVVVQRAAKLESMPGGLNGFVTKKIKKHNEDHESMGRNLAKWAECLLWRSDTARESIATGQFVQIDWKPALKDKAQKYFPKGELSCRVYEGDRPSIWAIDFEPPASLVCPGCSNSGPRH
jgi:hypothetical protein